MKIEIEISTEGELAQFNVDGVEFVAQFDGYRTTLTLADTELSVAGILSYAISDKVIGAMGAIRRHVGDLPLGSWDTIADDSLLEDLHLSIG